MTEPKDRVEAIVSRIQTLSKEDISTVVAAVPKFFADRNQALLAARQLVTKTPDWADNLSRVENAATRRFRELGMNDTLDLAVLWNATQGALLATLTKSSLSPEQYRLLVKPAAVRMPWLLDESDVGKNAPLPAEVVEREDDRDDVEPESSEEEPEMAVATKPTTKSAQKRVANAANSKPDPKPEVAETNGGNGHQQTEFFAKGKKDGVRIKPTRGGFSVCVIGENHRVLTGHFASADLAAKGAEKAGLTVKKLPGRGSEVVATEEKRNPAGPKPNSASGIQRAAESLRGETHPVPKPSFKKKGARK